MATDASSIIPKINWHDPAAIATYVTSAATALFGVLSELGVAVPANAPTDIKEWTGIAAFGIAAIVQIVNVFTHRSVQKAALKAMAVVVTAGRKQMPGS